MIPLGKQIGYDIQGISQLTRAVFFNLSNLTLPYQSYPNITKARFTLATLGGNFGKQRNQKILPKIDEVFTHKYCFVSTFHFYRFEYAEINDFKSFQTLLF